MKVQCPCGAKYAFDVTPEMVAHPIRFVCQSCGLDSSASVNAMIRQQATAPTAAVPPPPSPAPPAPAAEAKPAVRVEVNKAPPTAAVAPSLKVAAHVAPAVAAAPAAEGGRVCLKHAGQLTTHCCLVCQKPICPKCMELFGYVCSAYCHGKAETLGLELPVCKNQKAYVEARSWKKVRLVSYSIILVVVALLGAYAWYAFVGSKPRVAFSVPFPEVSLEAQCKLLSPERALLLRNGRLTHYDLKTGKEVWSTSLLNREKIQEQAAKKLAEWKVELQKWSATRQRLKASGKLDDEEVGFDNDKPRSESAQLKAIADGLETELLSHLKLFVVGQDLWIAFPDRLTRIDGQSGQPGQEVLIPGALMKVIRGDGYLFALSESVGDQQTLTRINAASGDAQSEQIVLSPMLVAAPARLSNPLVARARSTNSTAIKSTGTKPLAAKAATQLATQKGPLPAARKQPAAAASEEEEAPAEFMATDHSRAEFVAAGESALQFSVRLIELKTAQRQVMKDAPKTSALDGTVNAAATANIANEIFNEFERERTGGVELEDVSRYQVTLKRALAPGAAEWTGEVVGPPELFPLQTIDLLVAGQTVLGFDRSNKKIWESKLAYRLATGGGWSEDVYADDDASGLVPCVERDGTVYLFDQGVLTAFELATGNARWRLPSVGISKLHFDGKGMLYVDTTTASPDKIKYSQQIDISQKIGRVILKLEAKTGRILWKASNVGRIHYATGKFVYAVETDVGEDYGPLNIGIEKPAHVRISRLDAGNGSVLWEHYQKRLPVDVDFCQNQIQLLFKKEMQVLRYLTF